MKDDNKIADGNRIEDGFKMLKRGKIAKKKQEKGKKCSFKI